MGTVCYRKPITVSGANKNKVPDLLVFGHSLYCYRHWCCWCDLFLCSHAETRIMAGWLGWALRGRLTKEMPEMPAASREVLKTAGG